jgi:hypothetical protein
MASELCPFPREVGMGQNGDSGWKTTGRQRMSGKPEQGGRRQQEEAETPRPGVLARPMLRLIDGGIGWLRHMRRRFDATTAEGDGPASRTPVKDADEGAAAAAPRRGFWLRGLLVGLCCLVLGGGAGGFWAYRQFERQIGEHAGVVERMQEDIDSSAKEEKRAVNLMSRYQRENAEMRLLTRETQAEKEVLAARIEELEKDLAAARQAMKPAPAPKAAAPGGGRLPVASSPTRPPTKTGRCTAGSADQITDCIDQYNRK